MRHSTEITRLNSLRDDPEARPALLAIYEHLAANGPKRDPGGTIIHVVGCSLLGTVGEGQFTTVAAGHPDFAFWAFWPAPRGPKGRPY